ncbi:MAG: substrate-binding domain-containing protein, partial [Deltaproteobacteria bacterium]|nr:substrate-binding domain-containing protein [Deltaproteobacteria bacterium]
MKAKPIIVSGFLLAVGLIVFFTLTGKKDEPSGGSAAPPPQGVASQQVPPASATQFSFVYSSEKKEWIEAACNEFERAHPDIKIARSARGSLDSAQDILDEKSKPTLWSPADSLVLALLESDWDTKFHTPLFSRDGEDAPQSLVITPLVFVVWEDRATVLQKAAGGQVSWATIRAAVVSDQGWPAIGGDASWGFVKLGHTDPTRSNSGLQALLLMSLEYYKKTSGLQIADILDPTYQQWVKDIERGVTKFEASTGTFMTDMVRFGPSKYDIAVVYENLAISQLENAQGRWGSLKVYYPGTTIWSDHPVALVKADWVTPAQRDAARQLLAFLKSRPVQEQALAYG